MFHLAIKGQSLKKQKIVFSFLSSIMFAGFQIKIQTIRLSGWKTNPIFWKEIADAVG